MAGSTDETVDMRTWKLPLLTVVAALCVPATASAAFEHVVAPGESLYSVAAADGLSVDQLASANGISADTELTAGTTLAIPPQTGDTATAVTAVELRPRRRGPAAPAAAPSSAGGYVVQPGDTLSAIAARYGVSVGDLAAANGLSPDGLLLAGSSLSVSGAPSGRRRRHLPARPRPAAARSRPPRP